LRSAEGHDAATTKQRAHGRPPLQSTAARAQQHGPVRFRKPGAAKAAPVSRNQGSGGARFRKPGAGKAEPQSERHSAPQRAQKAAWRGGGCPSRRPSFRSTGRGVGGAWPAPTWPRGALRGLILGRACGATERPAGSKGGPARSANLRFYAPFA
jgi:hypothetical protein